MKNLICATFLSLIFVSTAQAQQATRYSAEAISLSNDLLSCDLTAKIINEGYEVINASEKIISEHTNDDEATVTISALTVIFGKPSAALNGPSDIQGITITKKNICYGSEDTDGACDSRENTCSEIPKEIFAN